MVAPVAATIRERTAGALQRVWEGRGVLSAALLPPAWAFGALAATRRQLFARGLRESSHLPVPVIVVGNLVVGGAGKTPTTIAIVKLLRRAGYTPGIVSRGYGRNDEDVVVVAADANAKQVGDEPLLLQRRTGAPVAVGADRVAAGHALLRADAGIDVVVSDDGLQHLALGRDVEVLVFDERGAGNGRLLPAGPLRERVPDALRPNQIVLYNADAPTTPLPGHVARRTLAGVTPLDAWWEGAAPSHQALDALRDRDVVAVAGLARPGRFFAMLRAQGLRIVERAPGDHADFATLPWPPGATDVVLTEKDAVKLPRARALGTRVWVARLDFVPEPAFDAALLALLPAPSSIDANGNTPA
ncbi:MAG TPA: tetraacyldisaccharide 4'-kinase [Caldimonas sp.]|nr:tetraacyldisaccharide 4'-kinase [Caldimonas sp.]HEV7575590.1 tetraacyldisaccharide 4'-kinase [Caldimonas sp.]